MDVTWEVAANEEEERVDGNGVKGDSGFVSDGDRPERLMFDHDYDTDTEAEGRRDRWGDLYFSNPKYQPGDQPTSQETEDNTNPGNRQGKEAEQRRTTRPYEVSDTDSDSSDSFSDYSSDDSDGAKRISRTPTETQAPRYKRGTLEAARLGTNADERAERRRNARRNRLKPADPG